MPEYSALGWALILAAAFGDGFLVRTFGQGIGIALTPLLTLAFSPRFSLGLLGLYSTLAAWGMARAVWKKWDRRAVLAVLPGELAGLIIGAWVVARLPDAHLRLVIGLLCLGFALHRTHAELRGREAEVAPLPLWLGTTMGGISGITSVLANTGATVLTLFLHSQRFGKTTLLATLWLVFFIFNPLKLVAYWQTGVIGPGTLLTAAAGLPMLFAGLWAGAWAHERLSGRAFNLIILAIALAGSARLLTGALGLF